MRNGTTQLIPKTMKTVTSTSNTKEWQPVVRLSAHQHQISHCISPKACASGARKGKSHRDKATDLIFFSLFVGFVLLLLTIGWDERPYRVTKGSGQMEGETRVIKSNFVF